MIPYDGEVAGSEHQFSKSQMIDDWQIDYIILNSIIGRPKIKTPDLVRALV